MSGQTSCDKPFQEKLDQRLKKLGLEKVNQNIEEVSKYLSLQEGELSALEAETCLERAAELLQYSITLRLETNRHKATIEWCNSEISRICSPEWNNYFLDSKEFVAKDIKINAIANENPMLRSLLILKQKALAFYQDTEEISNLVKQYSDLFKDLGKVKKWN